MKSETISRTKNILIGVSEYLLWGVLPVYWKALKEVPASELLSHRIAWSAFFLTLFALPKTGRVK